MDFFTSEVLGFFNVDFSVVEPGFEGARIEQCGAL
jgi:hypothetical protein